MFCCRLKQGTRVSHAVAGADAEFAPATFFSDLAIKCLPQVIRQ